MPDTEGTVSTVTIEISLHRTVTEAEAEDAMYAALGSLTENGDNQSEDDDWTYGVDVQHGADDAG